MGVLVREVLKRLCVEFGWSYAVFWKAIQSGGDQMHLVWESGHCERNSVPLATSGFEAMDMLIKQSGVLQSSRSGGFSQIGSQVEDRVQRLVFELMANQVHVLGDGIVGKVALTGKHEWVLATVLADNGSIPTGLAEIDHQLSAGIKTVAFIPVLSHGVVQLGSTQMVLENLGFINHVEGLFKQLQFVPGALLSNTTHKKVSQKIQKEWEFGEVCTSTNGLSSLMDDNNNNGHNFRHPDSQAASEPCLSSIELYEQNSIGASDPLPKENMSSPMMQHITQPVVHNAIHLNTHLENGHENAHLLMSNPDARLLKDVLPCKSTGFIQQQLPSGLCCTKLTYLEEQLLTMSGIRPGEFTKSTLDNANMHLLKSDGCTSLIPPQGSETVSLFARSQLLDCINNLGKFNSFPSCTKCLRSQCHDQSCALVPQVSKTTNHSTGNHMVEPGHISFIENACHSGSYEEKQTSGNCQLQMLKGQSAQFDEHSSPSCLFLSNPPEDSSYNNRIQQDSAFVENVRDPSASCNGNKCNENADLQSLDKKASLNSQLASSGNDLFALFHLGQYKFGFSCGNSNNVNLHGTHELSTDISTCITELEEDPVYNALSDEICCSGMFSGYGSDQLLDAVVSQFNPGAEYEIDDSASCKTSSTNIRTTSLNTPANRLMVFPKQEHAKSRGRSPVLIKAEPEPSSSIKSSCSVERGEGCIPQSNGHNKSQINLWIGSQKRGHDNHFVKKVDEAGKQIRKRAKPGENSRPRPKDRQMIQDRVKELREIIPNGAKCSIDALLEKTIKHMVFMQSVTKHADTLKEIGQSKILCKEGGLLLKDNFEGGATWAFEVGNQSMICPIIVEDLNPPRQLLVEMLCEERGPFLEIADLVRGLGLTILKGAMEVRNDKVWARFAVEANRDVTRMEIFLSLVQLLDPSGAKIKTPELVYNLSNPVKPQDMFHSPSSIPATGLPNHIW